MKIAICDDMRLCSEAEVKRLLPLVSPQRQQAALRYKHLFGQWSTLQSWILLHDLGLSDKEWLYNEYGKPYVAEGPCFSLSHCKEGIAVAVHETPIGIDIEEIRKASTALIARTMNECEQDLIAQSKQPDIAFTALWTQKEAYLKFIGTGIINDLHQVLAHTQDIKIETVIKEKYIYSLAYRHSGDTN